MTRVSSHLSDYAIEVELDPLPPPLAYHFDNAAQQSSAAKLGMRLFLSTKLLLFGSLFCLYIVIRSERPEIFTYGSRYLDITWGVISTTILIFSSLTMALAMWSAKIGHRRALCLYLGLTLMCAVNFLGIRYIEYSHNFHTDLWGIAFLNDVDAQQVDVTTAEPEITLQPGDIEHGKQIFLRTCLSCHGVSGDGLPGLGKPLTTSRFVAELTDLEFVKFLQKGRAPKDPDNTSGLAMPARGGNPRLLDQDLADVIAHVRTLQTSAGNGETITDSDPVFVITHSVVPLAAIGPAGLVKIDNATNNRLLIDPRIDPDRPAQAHLFFGLYILMTGLHGIHVLVGVLVISWLLIRALRGHFGTTYFTPVDLGRRYWHVVDLIWLFLFPLFYLVW